MRKIFSTMLVLLLAIFLSGCLDNPTPEDRQLCIELTSYPKTTIPKCSTQEECFSKAESVFNLSDDYFSPDLRSSLHLYKNKLSLSWLYYNRALSNIKRIQNICRESENFSPLLSHVNELNSNLLNAFASLDAANHEAFTSLALARRDLTYHEIDLAPEEPLFNDYVRINDNINLLSSGNVPESPNSFAGIYLSRTAYLSQLSEDIGFGPINTNEFSTISLIAEYDDKLIPAVFKSQDILTRLTLDAALNMVDYFNNQITMGNAVQALQHFPSFEVLNAYNDLAGGDNSAASFFASIMSSTYNHTEELILRNQSLTKALDSNILSAQSSLASLDSTTYASFEPEFLSELYSALGQETQIKTADNSISDISAFTELAHNELVQIKALRKKLYDEKYFDELSLGRECDTLKQLTLRTEALNEHISYFSSEVTLELDVLCSNRISHIETELSENDYSSSTLPQISDISASLEFRISNYNSANNLTDRLLLCSPIINEYTTLKSAIDDFENYQIETGKQLSECIKYLQSTFSSDAEELSIFAGRYSALTSHRLPYKNPSEILSACLDLREDVDETLAQNSLSPLYLNYELSRESLSFLESLNSLEPGNQESLASLEEEFREQFSLFKEGHANAPQALLNLDSLETDTRNFKQSLSQAVQDSFSNYLSKNHTLEIFNPQTPEPGKKYSTTAKLTLENNIRHFNSPVSIQIPAKIPPSAKVTFKTPNILSADIKENEILLNLSSVPLGKSVIEFEFEDICAHTGFEEKIISASNDSALIKRTLSLDTSGTIPMLKIPLYLPPSAENISAYAHNNRLELFSGTSGQYLELKNAHSSQEIEIYYSLPNPLAITSELISQTALDANNSELSYKINVKNNSDLDFKKLEVSASIPINPSLVVEETLYAPNNRKIPVTLLPDNEVSFQINNLPPLQSSEFSLFLKIYDESSYWNSISQNLNSTLSTLSTSSFEKVSQEANSLLAKLTSDEPSLLGQLAAETNALLNLEELLSKQNTNYETARNSVAEEIEGAQEKIDELEESGYGDYANKISDSLKEAENKLNESDNFYLNKDFNRALLSISRARSALDYSPPVSLSAAVFQDRNSLIHAAKKLFVFENKFFPNSPQLSQLRTDFLTVDSALMNLLNSKNTTAAIEKISSMKTLLSDYNSTLLTVSKQSSTQTSKTIQKFKSLNENLPELLKQLKKAISDAPLPTTPAAEYTPPITETELASFETTFKEETEKITRAEFTTFEKSLENEDYLSAIESSEEFENSLNAAVEKLESIESTATNAITKMEHDAKVALYSATKKYNLSEYNNEADALVEGAKKSFKEQEYFKSAVLSNNATALLTYESANNLTLPLSLIPFILIIAAVMYIRFKDKKAALRIPKFFKILRHRHNNSKSPSESKSKIT